MKFNFPVSLRFYRITRDFDYSSLSESNLKAMAFTPCHSTQMASMGWISPFDSEFSVSIDGWVMLTARREVRVMPAAVVRDKLREVVEKREAEQERRLRHVERTALKEGVIAELMPRAFTRQYKNRIFINVKTGLVMVDTCSARCAENLLTMLRKTTGSLPVIPLTMETSPELTFTRWLTTKFPNDFAPGEDTTLVSMLNSRGSVRCNHQDLLSDEIRVHIEAGKLAVSIGLNWQDRASFRLSDDMSIKGLKFCESIMLQNDEINSEDQALRFEADYLLFVAEINSLLNALMEAAGGEARR